MTAAIGDGWITDLEQIQKLAAFAGDDTFLDDFALAKRKNKETLAAEIKAVTGMVVSPDALFDVQIKANS